MRKAFLLAIVVAACSDATGPTKSVMTALVNGNRFNGTPLTASTLGILDTSTKSLAIIGIQAISPEMSENVVLTLRDFHGAGQYETCGTVSSMFGLYERVDALDTMPTPVYTTDTACGGMVDVQSYFPATMLITGTFHFSGTSLAAPDTIHVTDGQFSGMIRLTGFILDPPSPPAKR